jgi:SsrA-binding protein
MSLIRNKKVHLDYAILDTFEAGIELFGFEVKSIRAGRGILEGSRVLVRGGEAFLVGSQIPAYQQANTPKDYEETRTRRLLLNKKQIETLYSAAEQEGLTIVPISLYNKKAGTIGGAGFIKCEVAIVKGKKKQDKREDLKKKDAQREGERITKSHRR